MKKVIMAFALVLISALCFAGNQQTKASKDSTNSGQVVVMNKNMFINDVFDYQNTPDWKYKGKLPAIIDLYADWCGPCRMVAPIMKEARQQQAEKRMKDIEQQLSGSKYGIAYTDGTEKITQLNRPIGNNLMGQIEYLTSMLYSQLGITQSILDGTADERTMLNYHNRTIEPIVSSITDESKRKFLTKTARSQNQSITFFRDPFKLVPVNDLSEIADKFTRNEILSSNEVRQIIGMKPSADPKADELRNKNLTTPVDPNAVNAGQGGQPTYENEV